MTSPTIDEREYWDRKAARIAEDGAAARATMNDPEVVLHRLEVEYAATPDGDHAKRTAIRTEISRLSAEYKAAQAAAYQPPWTLEETKANRIAWNDRSRSGQTPLQIVRELGFSFAELKRVIEHYGL